MKATTLEEMLSDMRNGVYNLTDHGKCTQCGSCCSNLLPMTQNEIEKIKQHIKKNRIKEQVHGIPLAKPTLDLTCPFLDTGKKTEKCTIYDVRPSICRCFICSEPNGAMKHKELWEGDYRVVNVRSEFFNC